MRYIRNLGEMEMKGRPLQKKLDGLKNKVQYTQGPCKNNFPKSGGGDRMEASMTVSTRGRDKHATTS